MTQSPKSPNTTGFKLPAEFPSYIQSALAHVFGDLRISTVDAVGIIAQLVARLANLNFQYDTLAQAFQDAKIPETTASLNQACSTIEALTKENNALQMRVDGQKADLDAVYKLLAQERDKVTDLREQLARTKRDLDAANAELAAVYGPPNPDSEKDKEPQEQLAARADAAEYLIRKFVVGATPQDAGALSTRILDALNHPGQHRLFTELRSLVGQFVTHLQTNHNTSLAT